MRIWKFHPKYFDPKGFVAQWFEAYILRNKLVRDEDTSQLKVFKEPNETKEAQIMMIDRYALELYRESKERGYNFNAKLFNLNGDNKYKYKKSEVMAGQYYNEWVEFNRRVKNRNFEWWVAIDDVECPESSPIFTVINDNKLDRGEK